MAKSFFVFSVCHIGGFSSSIGSRVGVISSSEMIEAGLRITGSTFLRVLFLNKDHIPPLGQKHISVFT